MHTVPLAARLLLIASVVAWAAVELRKRLYRRPGADRNDGGSMAVLTLSYVVGIFAAVLCARNISAARIGDVGVTVWIGLVLLWIGMALRVWSIRTLAGYFTYTVQTSADQPVVTDGPYRFVRHPSYTGLLVAMAGVGVLYGNWVSVLAIVVAVGAGLSYRIRVEERALEAAIGQPYRDYAATHRRLIPHVL